MKGSTMLGRAALALVGTLSMWANVVKANDDLGDWCGSVATQEWLAEDRATVANRSTHVPRRTGSITVNTYFHVVANSTRLQDGWLTDNMLADQLAHLNRDYASSDISFVLVNTTRQVHDTWATARNGSDQLAMKRALRQGNYSALNIYFLTSVTESGSGRGLNGQCSFPTGTVTRGSNAFYNDGCVVLHEKVPGASKQGTTTTHEVGHWFGLRHTFQGGCTGDGDGVDDTPAEATPSRDCNGTRNTCPDQEGFDPVRNFMDYSPENQFTPGQTVKMQSSWHAYRV